MPAVEGGFSRKQKKEDLFQKRLRLIYDTVLEARDQADKERDLVSIFMKLPSKKEYPDYYQVGICIFSFVRLCSVRVSVHFWIRSHISLSQEITSP